MMISIMFLLLLENKIINNKVIKIVTDLNGKIFEKIKNRDLEKIIRSVADQIKMYADSDMIVNLLSWKESRKRNHSND